MTVRSDLNRAIAGIGHSEVSGLAAFKRLNVALGQDEFTGNHGLSKLGPNAGG
jgi:hypothetical protein